MPHLAPLNWLFGPLAFWFILALILSYYWWTTPPMLSPLGPSLANASPSWNWG